MPMTLKSMTAFLAGRRKREKHERQVEQATKAPGEKRDVKPPRG